MLAAGHFVTSGPACKQHACQQQCNVKWRAQCYIAYIKVYVCTHAAVPSMPVSAAWLISLWYSAGACCYRHATARIALALGRVISASVMADMRSA